MSMDVLIIEENPDARSVTGAVVRMACDGVGLESTDNLQKGKEILDRLIKENSQIIVIIGGISEHGMSGPEFIQCIWEAERYLDCDVPKPVVIAMSGGGQKSWMTPEGGCRTLFQSHTSTIQLWRY